MSKNKSIFSALFVMLLWGTLFPMVKLGFSKYGIVSTGDILYFAGVRFTIGGVVICGLALLKSRELFKSVKTYIVPILLSGLFAIILHYTFTYAALSLTGGSKTAILKQMGALFYVCFSFVFFKDDKFSVKKIVGALMGLLGIIAINCDFKSISFNIGDVFILSASLCTVASNIISKKTFKEVNTVALTGISQLFGGIVLLVIGKCLGGTMTFSLETSPVMIYICIASIISYLLWFINVKSGELSKLFVIKFAEPVFACIFSAMLLGENIFNIQYLLAFILISGGIYVVNK